ncbi:MAG: hypothetical protein H6730_25540 [Deltaproteobacteria bacterium]|nr:hypothetical protein [Deltaproteobacteria bacterium]
MLVLEHRLTALHVDTPRERIMSLKDLIVVSDGPDDDHKILVLNKARVDLNRVAVFSSGMSIFRSSLPDPAEIVFNDLHTEGGIYGFDVAAGTSLSLTRAEILDTTGFGLLVGSLGVNDTFSLASGTDVVIRPRDGVPAIAGANGALELERFLIEGPATHGIQSVANGEVSLHDGTLRQLEVGVSIQDIPDYDITKLIESVRYLGVARPLSLAQ